MHVNLAKGNTKIKSSKQTVSMMELATGSPILTCAGKGRLAGLPNIQFGVGGKVTYLGQGESLPFAPSKVQQPQQGYTDLRHLKVWCRSEQPIAAPICLGPCPFLTRCLPMGLPATYNAPKCLLSAPWSLCWPSLAAVGLPFYQPNGVWASAWRPAHACMPPSIFTKCMKVLYGTFAKPLG